MKPIKSSSFAEALGSRPLISAIADSALLSGGSPGRPSRAVRSAAATMSLLPPPPSPLQLQESEEIPPFLLSTARLPLPRSSLCKQRTWSPDMYREEAWARRKGSHMDRQRRTKSVTDEDLDELKACIELGFGFDSPEVDPKLSDTFPALEFYYAVLNNKQFNDAASKSSNDTDASDGGSTPMSPTDSPRHRAMFSPGENPRVVKTRLRQWAQVVACSVRQSSA